MASSYGLYAYGLIGRNPEPLAILGMDKKSPVYAVEGKESCVMVSEIDVDSFQEQVKQLVSELTGSGGAVQSRAEEMLQAHEDVVDTLMKSTTVVPFQFGTILKDEQAVLTLLNEHEEKFKKLLAKFVGRAEWGMKVYADQQEFIKYFAQFEQELNNLAEKQEGLSRGVAYLLGRKREETVKDNALTRLAEISEAIFHKLGKTAYEGKLNKTLPQKLTGKKKEMILNTVYLVEREKVATFCKQGKRLMEHYRVMGLELEFSGPWPPYSFTY
jgi:type I site-specific restriction endonuclease